MYISTKELSRAFTILLEYVKKQGIHDISFASNDAYYQKIWFDDRNLVGTPEWTLGDSDDDIEAIKRILEDDFCYGYHLERIGAVLTILGAVMARDKSIFQSHERMQIKTTELLQAITLVLSYLEQGGN